MVGWKEDVLRDNPFSAVKSFSPLILFIYNKLGGYVVKRHCAQTPLKLYFCSLCVAFYVV